MRFLSAACTSKPLQLFHEVSHVNDRPLWLSIDSGRTLSTQRSLQHGLDDLFGVQLKCLLLKIYILLMYFYIYMCVCVCRNISPRNSPIKLENQRFVVNFLALRGLEQLRLSHYSWLSVSRVLFRIEWYRSFLLSLIANMGKYT